MVTSFINHATIHTVQTTLNTLSGKMFSFLTTQTTSQGFKTSDPGRKAPSLASSFAFELNILLTHSQNTINILPLWH